MNRALPGYLGVPPRPEKSSKNHCLYRLGDTSRNRKFDVLLWFKSPQRGGWAKPLGYDVYDACMHILDLMHNGYVTL